MRIIDSFLHKINLMKLVKISSCLPNFLNFIKTTLVLKKFNKKNVSTRTSSDPYYLTFRAFCCIFHFRL